MLDVDETFQESQSMNGPLGAVAFVTLKALSTAGAPEETRERVSAALLEYFAKLSNADCNVLSEVVHRRLRDRPPTGEWYPS